MFSTLRNRFGIPGVISVIALVFAMIGGAYAATNSGDGKGATASAKKKAAKRPRGPRGATGPAGAVGPAGPAGAKGDPGAAGSNGSNGADGAKGATGSAGASVTSTLEPPGANCASGGSKFVAGASTTYACNGSNGAPGTPGAPGPPGSAWTAGGTLPVGSTQTGSWAINGGTDTDPTAGKKFGFVFTEISFPIPLAAGLDSAHTVFVPDSAPNPDPTHCSGTPDSPKAASGYLCVYQGFSTGAGTMTFGSFVTAVSGEDALPTGTNLLFFPSADEQFATGTFAVTG